MQLPIRPGAPIHLTARMFGPAGECELDAVLDTGSLFVTIPPECAQELGYDPENAPLTKVVTAGGVIHVPQITLGRLVVCEEFEAANIPALCLNVSAAGTRCLLGLAFLSRLNFSVDNKAGTLTITDP
ncbi:MAG: hypothetical protein FJ291_22085 [Planctomycetes bacterium]|nr:hypothetical protein [Planctomycetota bacterium]